MTTLAKQGFGKLRMVFWPIHRRELRKFLPMLMIYSLIVFNYSILKPVKDALLITAPESGAAALPYIKLWAILPMAFLSTLIFTRLSNRYSRERVFYIMMFTFLSFFFLFAFVLFPNRGVLHPHALADKIQELLPKGLQGLVAIFRNWTFTLFYVMSELWGTIIMSVLFWGFANEVSSVGEAKRFYSILGVGANLATICAGQMGIFLSGSIFQTKILFGSDRWEQSLILISSLILITGLITTGIYRWLCTNVFKKELRDSGPMGPSGSQVIKMGMRKNFSYLANSKYLICIAVLVLGFNLCLSMIEVLWKDQIHHLHPYPADYNIYMSKVLTYIGVLSTLFGLLVCGQVIRRFGWAVGAYTTPVVLAITGVLFFGFLLFKEAPPVVAFSAFFGVTPVVMSAFFGSMQNCFSRAAKFTFFDVTKEMSFIPLSPESKLKGKAAIDGVGSRLGKSGGSLFHQLLLMAFGSVALSTPYVGIVIFLALGAWMAAVRSLGKQFAELSQSKDLEASQQEVGVKKEPFAREGTTELEPSKATV